MFLLRYGADIVLCHDGFQKNLHHQRYAVIHHLPHSGKEPPGHGKQADQDGEQRLQKGHYSVLFDAENSDPVKPGYQINPRVKVTEEEFYPPADVSLR